MTDRYAIIGHPVAHSKSPEIHTAFALATGEALVYERLLAPLEDFRGTVDAFRANGGRGASVTLPFKVEAFNYATELTTRARLAGAVNALKFDGTTVLGDNTDGIGMCRDISKNFGVPLKDAKILVLGAGGAARGVIGPLCDGLPQQITIANRTHSKAEEIANQFSGAGPVNAIPTADLAGLRFDIIINATSASIGNQLPGVAASCFGPRTLAYDMMYGKGVTPFMQLATSEGARAVDGLGMLIEQAAEAFLLWRGIRPTTDALMKKMRGG
ncbi:MAG: shikimate dehydrogenase [Betaproteobacteria bacterium]